MRISKSISKLILLSLLCFCSSPELAAVAADTSAGQSGKVVSSESLVQEFNEILKKGRQFLSGEKYDLAEKQFTYLCRRNMLLSLRQA